MILDLHHIQLAMPEGREDDARAFYAGILDLTEVEKPTALRGRGGVWFETGTVRLHLGAEMPFTPARKAHPALRVASLAMAIAHLERHQIPYQRDIDLPGMARIYLSDPFGNRIELLETSPTPITPSPR